MMIKDISPNFFNVLICEASTSAKQSLLRNAHVLTSTAVRSENT